MYHHHLYSKVPKVALLKSLLSFRRGPTIPHRPVTPPNPVKDQTIHFWIASSTLFLTILLDVFYFLRRLALGPLCRCLISAVSVLYSKVRPLGALTQHSPWFVFSVVSSRPSVLHERPSCSARTTWRVISLRAATDFFWDPPTSWGRVFSCWRRLSQTPVLG
jgi:hypothetical protein